MRWAGLVGSLGLLGLCACTHLVQETAQPVRISSEPAGATVSIGPVRHEGSTPMTVTLDPRRTHEVRVEKDCYAASVIVLRPGMGLRTYGPYSIPVSQLDAALHAHLQPTCAPLVKKEGR